ncbi:unnamed protein product [Lactuca virosa]|uniref:Protein kinase domain-containing protein n=1 Tax=Lactuca virosa TaxID=75947 RepID=A0AAU9MF28_9ASTR|nr:unnamed protein product [Lactuca virosa]
MWKNWNLQIPNSGVSKNRVQSVQASATSFGSWKVWFIYMNKGLFIGILRGVVKLVDFGVSMKLTEAHVDMHFVVGSPYWMAPEMTILPFRDVEMTEKLDYSSVAAILRAFIIKSEATRVMVAAPLIAFVTTHILYLNCYQFDFSDHGYSSGTFFSFEDDP